MAYRQCPKTLGTFVSLPVGAGRDFDRPVHVTEYNLFSRRLSADAER